MFRHLVRMCLLSTAIAASLMAATCVTRTRQYVFEVRRGVTAEEKVDAAKRMLTEERLARLKEQLRKKYPDLSDAHLDHFGIRWSERWPITPDGRKGNPSVAIMVIMEERKDIDTAAIVESAARILDAEINGPDNTAIEPAAK